MINYEKLSAVEYVENVSKGELDILAGVEYFVNRIKNDHRNSVLEVFEDSAKAQANEMMTRLSKGEKLGRLGGVPIIIKDNILYKGHIASAGSKMLENFVSPYNATIVNKLLAEDAIILGRANMDEFAMGSTGENSAYGKTLNAHSDNAVAGGSSSGSAVAVASGMCVASIGTDTGGSVRCPASYNGVFAIKPTYGTVSRYGIVAYASGLEQAGPICKTAEDTGLLLDIISGKDINDATTITKEISEEKDLSKLKIGYIKQVWEYKDKIQDIEKHEKIYEDFKNNGAEVIDISIPELELVLPTYYIIATAEATSNLSRYDGVKYTSKDSDSTNLEELYNNTRTKYFGNEVKRRIMLGNFVLSSGYFDAYYNKAKSIQTAIKNQLIEAFKKCDVIIMPIMLSDALEFGHSISDPVSMYLEDLFTIIANITGVPALAVPFATGKKGLPVGFQILAKHHNEKVLFDVAKKYQSIRSSK